MMSSPHQVHFLNGIIWACFFLPFLLICINEKNPERLKRASTPDFFALGLDHKGCRQTLGATRTRVPKTCLWSLLSGPF